MRSFRGMRLWTKYSRPIYYYSQLWNVHSYIFRFFKFVLKSKRAIKIWNATKLKPNGGDILYIIQINYSAFGIVLPDTRNMHTSIENVLLFCCRFSVFDSLVRSFVNCPATDNVPAHPMPCAEFLVFEYFFFSFFVYWFGQRRVAEGNWVQRDGSALHTIVQTVSIARQRAEDALSATSYPATRSGLRPAQSVCWLHRRG